MTATPLDEQLETKAFGALAIKDAERGEVTAIVATLGVVDRDGDVLLPGAFPEKSVVQISHYRHSLIREEERPVGKGIVTVEDDKAVFHGTYFMESDWGRDNFHIVKGLAPDGEWSFGYPRNVKTAPLTDEWRGKGAKRLIAGILPVEVSPVFIGAGIGTQTVAAKAADEAAAALATKAAAAAEARAAALRAVNSEADRLFARGRRVRR